MSWGAGSLGEKKERREERNKTQLEMKEQNNTEQNNTEQNNTEQSSERRRDTECNRIEFERKCLCSGTGWLYRANRERGREGENKE